MIKFDFDTYIKNLDTDYEIVSQKRKQILERDMYICFFCKKVGAGGIGPKNKTKKCTDDNLISLHLYCNEPYYSKFED